MNCVYLDYNATTPVDPQVLDAMLPYFSADFANASSIHTPGQRARAAVETARERVAALIGAKPQEIVFTSGGTESDNHAIFGSVAQALLPVRLSSPQLAPPHIITTTIEHEAVLNACQAAEKQGASVTYLQVDREAQVDPEAVRRAIRPETILITIMHANNEIGTVQPLEKKSAESSKNTRTRFHTDLPFSPPGKIPIDVNTLNVDMVSLSGHKLYAPKGVGALYIRSGTRARQFLYGGHHQRGARPGTENVTGIVGLGKAAEIARKSLTNDAQRSLSVTRQTRTRPDRARPPANPRERQSSSAHSQHHQHSVRGHRRRSPGHLARPERSSLLGRRSLFLRRRRAIARPHRHRPLARRSQIQPPLQPRPPHHRISEEIYAFA